MLSFEDAYEALEAQQGQSEDSDKSRVEFKQSAAAAAVDHPRSRANLTLKPSGWPDSVKDALCIGMD